MLNRPVEFNGGIYRYHEVTEVRHIVGKSTRAIVRSYSEEAAGFYMERSFDRDFDDRFTVEDAYAWISGMAEFEEHVDERDEIISELASSLTDEQAAKVPWAYPAWEAGTEYALGDRVTFDGAVYRVIQAHESQEAHTPNAAASLYAAVLPGQQGNEGSEEEGYPDWVQPDSTNPYMTGDRVSYEGTVYESTVDNNVWSPADYPQGWSVVEEEEDGGEEVTE